MTRAVSSTNGPAGLSALQSACHRIKLNSLGADGQRPYRDRSETDPRGEEGEGVAWCVVRGGSWRSSAWRVRSAHHGAYSRDFLGGDLGFPFALRSPEPAGPAPEGR